MAQDDEILGALDQVDGSDRLRSRRLRDGVASLIVDATGLDAAQRQDLEQRLRAAALALEGVADVRLAMTAAQQRRQLIAIASGKGGVGKSTLTVNLAVALARAGRRVGLIDADVYGPSQTQLLGTDEKPTAADDQLIPVDAHGLKFLSLGQLVSAGHALAWRGPMATGALSRLLDADWGDRELLLVDLPPGTGDIQLTLIKNARPDGVVIVSTPQDLALIDATRAIDLFRKTGVPIIGLVENMAGYVCPHCGEDSEPFGSGGAEAAAERLGIEFLGRLPLSLALRRDSDAGIPPALGDGPEARAFAALAERIAQKVEPAAA